VTYSPYHTLYPNLYSLNYLPFQVAGIKTDTVVILHCIKNPLLSEKIIKIHEYKSQLSKKAMLLFYSSIQKLDFLSRLYYKIKKLILEFINPKKLYC